MVAIETSENEPIVEGDENKKVQEKKQLIFTVEILKIIKDAQQQHGLRHGDFQRYRGYCTRRIRRLRKVLKATQGDRRHFKKKDINESMLKDERFLYIPLMMAERAWGYAMQLRQEANTEPRKRYHLIQRLRKATIYALQLQTLCESSVCDARTKLEAQAYVAWIHGSLHFELQLWKPAMENLKKAQVVYEKLAQALAEEEQGVYKSRVDELAPSLRYCAYNIGDESALDDLMTLRAGQGDLLSNLDSLIEKTRKQHPDVTAEVEWRGRTVQIRPERVGLFLSSDKQLDTAVNKSATTADKIELIENDLMYCKDAIASVRDEMKNDPNSKTPREKGQAVTGLQFLLSYLTYIRLQRTIERNLLMVEQLKVGETGRAVRPQDLTRLYEIILQNLIEMQQLAGLEEDSQFQQQVDNRIKCYKAFRCFCIAEYLVTLKRWHDSMAMYQRVEHYISQVQGGGEMKQEMNKLQSAVEGSKFSAHAHSVLEGEGGPDEDTAVVKQHRAKKPLCERLDEYKEDASLAGKNPNVVKLPPDMVPIPCKPLFFDLAFNFAEFPSLEHKFDSPGKKQNQAGITGFVKGLWGWGGGSK